MIEQHPLHLKLIDAISEYKTCPEAMRDAVWAAYQEACNLYNKKENNS